MELYDVVVVGAGPYGLSVAAHLKQLSLAVRIFGSPMQTWRNHMPAGMLLKSDGFASNLSDPHAAFSLKHYCELQGITYDDRRVPVKVETFIDYGEAFQRKFLPELDTREVTAVDRLANGNFSVSIEGGDQVQTRRVVLAVGISHFAYMPPELAALPPDLVSHSSAHRSPHRFKGEDVTILGAGSSAVDLATLLQEAGAKVCVLTRRPHLEFHQPPSAQQPSLRERLRRPSSGLGPGWPSWIYSNAPQLFRHLPSRRRLQIVRNHLGPAGGWCMRDRFEDKVTVIGDLRRLSGARSGSRLQLTIETAAGARDHSTGHLIAATGYRADVGRLPFLADSLRASVENTAGAPVLSPAFESSVPGLFFVGVAAAGTFGPLMRFAYGSAYTARTLAAHLRHSGARSGR